MALQPMLTIRRIIEPCVYLGGGGPMAVVRFDSEKTEGSGDFCQQPGIEALSALLGCEEGALAASFSPQRGFSWAFQSLI